MLNYRAGLPFNYHGSKSRNGAQEFSETIYFNTVRVTSIKNFLKKSKLELRACI